MAAVPQMGQPGSFWRGADGQVYVSGDTGTNAAGAWDANTEKYWSDRMYQLIDDPVTMVAGSSTSRAPSSGTGGSAPSGSTGSAAPQFKDTTALRSATQASLNALDPVLTNRLADEDVAYGNLIGTYDAEVGAQRGKLDEQVVGNEKALSTGNQAAMLAAAQGGRGLRATLAAMGALGGTGAVLADRAIMDSANKDLGGARENFDVNAKTLQTAWGDFEDSDKKRRIEAETVRTSNKKAVESDVLTQRQKLLQDMAGLWEQAGNTGEYNRLMGDATGLTPQIAAKSAPRMAYTPTEASYSPGKLDSYLAGAQNMQVGRKAGGVGASTALNNPLYAFTGSKEKDKELV